MKTPKWLLPVGIVAGVAAFVLRNKKIAVDSLRYSLAGIKITRYSIFNPLEVETEITLSIINPTQTTLEVTGIFLTVSAKGQELGTVTKRGVITIPSMASSTTSLPCDVNLLGIVSSVKDVINRKPLPSIDITGFIHAGEIQIPVNESKPLTWK